MTCGVRASQTYTVQVAKHELAAIEEGTSKTVNFISTAGCPIAGDFLDLKNGKHRVKKVVKAARMLWENSFSVEVL